MYSKHLRSIAGACPYSHHFTVDWITIMYNFPALKLTRILYYSPDYQRGDILKRIPDAYGIWEPTQRYIMMYALGVLERFSRRIVTCGFFKTATLPHRPQRFWKCADFPAYGHTAEDRFAHGRCTVIESDVMKMCKFGSNAADSLPYNVNIGQMNVYNGLQRHRKLAQKLDMFPKVQSLPVRDPNLLSPPPSHERTKPSSGPEQSCPLIPLKPSRPIRAEMPVQAEEEKHIMFENGEMCVSENAEEAEPGNLTNHTDNAADLSGFHAENDLARNISVSGSDGSGPQRNATNGETTVTVSERCNETDADRNTEDVQKTRDEVSDSCVPALLTVNKSRASTLEEGLGTKSVSSEHRRLKALLTNFGQEPKEEKAAHTSSKLKLSVPYFQQSLLLATQQQRSSLTKTKTKTKTSTSTSTSTSTKHSEEDSSSGGVVPRGDNEHHSNAAERLLSASTIHYYRPVFGTVGWLQADGQPDLQQEINRLSTFHKCHVPQGVWVTRLAEAGFYLADRASSTVRCAYCTTSLPIGRFINTNPWLLHTQDPSCPHLAGLGSNLPVHRYGEAASRTFIKALFHPQAQGSPAEGTPAPVPTLAGGGDGGGGGGGGGGSSATAAAPLPYPQTVSGLSHQSQSQGRHHHHHHGQAGFTQTGVSAAPQMPSINSSSERVGGTGASAVQTSLTLNNSEQGRTGIPATQASAAPRRAEAGSGSSQPGHPPLSQTSHAPRQVSSPAGQPFQTARYEQPQRAWEGGGGQTEINTTCNTNQASPAPSNAAAATAATASASGETRQQDRTLVTYHQLGIYTESPKRPDLAIARVRLDTFQNWPRTSTHPPQEMAEAGFYHVGLRVPTNDDLVRCFFCKGGLKNWESSLRPWVEHARWYPRCAFVNMVKGRDFVELVQELKNGNGGLTIDQDEIEAELRRRQLEMGQGGWLDAEGNTTTTTTTTTAHDVAGAMGGAIENPYDDSKDVEQIRSEADDLEKENQEIADIDLCKICQSNPSQVIFLPCGHLCACAQCAVALRTCACCRQRVEGRTRAVRPTD
ncbi:uncharacterized protein LOC143297895 [Babylonia areolata]|uniref:uncharacterized protein LOC143297895 n=1 Tax=Babylonia areolata TaxID=304850 RepID=UPI003FD69CFA